MSRCVIVSGGVINDYSFYSSKIKEDDYFICADGGIRHMLAINKIPDLWIGDFDSCRFDDVVNSYHELNLVETIKLNTDKDVTDTHYACIEAINRGYNEIVIWGACGGRIDHMLSNIYLLEFLADKGINALIEDDKNSIRLCRNNTIIKKYRKYISLLPIDNTVLVSKTNGLKYNVENYKFFRGVSVGVSNEIVDSYASIFVEWGSVLVIESDD